MRYQSPSVHCKFTQVHRVCYPMQPSILRMDSDIGSHVSPEHMQPFAGARSVFKKDVLWVDRAVCKLQSRPKPLHQFPPFVMDPDGLLPPSPPKGSTHSNPIDRKSGNFWFVEGALFVSPPSKIALRWPRRHPHMCRNYPFCLRATPSPPMLFGRIFEILLHSRAERDIVSKTV